MKLDESVIWSIENCAWQSCDRRGDPDQLQEFLKNLDLVFKPGNASQSILVKNLHKNDNIERSEVYKKRK